MKDEVRVVSGDGADHTHKSPATGDPGKPSPTDEDDSVGDSRLTAVKKRRKGAFQQAGQRPQ